MLEELKALHQELLKKSGFMLTGRQIQWLWQTEIVLSETLRTTLGRAFFRENRIELNAKLLVKYPNEIKPTFAHELAHLIAPLIYGKKGLSHGPGWKKVMQILGYPPERTHRLPVSELRRPHRVSAYATCACIDRQHPIKPITLRKMRYGRQRYLCLSCKSEIQLDSN